MDKIKELLQFENISVTEEQIRQLAAQRNIDINSVTDEDAVKLVSVLKAKQNTTALEVSNGASAPTPAKKQPRGRKNAKQVALENAIKQAAKETESELGTFETNLNRHKGLYVSHRSDAIVAEIRNTSTEIVEAVTDKLVKEVADVDTFQQIGDEFGAGLFALS